MHDIKWIRENAAAFDEAMKKRGLAPQSPELLKLDEEKRKLQTKIEELRSNANKHAREIGIAKSKGDNVTAKKLLEDQGVVGSEVQMFEKEFAAIEENLSFILHRLPNIPADDVLVGKDETSNKEIRQNGVKKNISNPKEHFELGEKLGLMDFELSSKIAGARFVVLKGQLARLERALASFMLDIHTKEFGYTEVAPPYLVKDNAMFGTGQLPKFGEDLFKTTTGHWLIPTAEVSLTNLVNDEIVNEADLPLRFAAYTPCFRSEAGSAGKDTRGMIRQHQFSKVELVSIVHPDKSVEEHERMTNCAEEILKRLGLHYRVMLLCTGDMGFSAKKTYDIEVWLPGQNAYREISSCSNCGDFQARRMKARFKSAGGKGTQFVHTLNGSGLPIGRTIVAILENYQQEGGSIAIPEVLQPYMDGAAVIKNGQ